MTDACLRVLAHNKGRILVWFSCGAASAVAAKITLERSDPTSVYVVYCDTAAEEHPDNRTLPRTLK